MSSMVGVVRFDPEDEDSRRILLAMALRWTWITLTQTVSLLRALNFRGARSGKYFTNDDVKACWARMRQSGMLLEEAHRPSHVQLVDAVRNRAYRELLEQHPVDKLCDALHASVQTRPDNFKWPFHAVDITIAVYRLEVFSGTETQSLERMRWDISRRFDWNTVLYDGFCSGFDGPLFDRIDWPTRAVLLFSAVRAVCAGWRLEFLPMARWAERQSMAQIRMAPAYLRLMLAEWMLHRGDTARLHEYLEGETSPSATFLRAAVLVQSGKWDEAAKGMATALKQRGSDIGTRKNVFPEILAFYYPLALLAGNSTKSIEAAAKFALSEAGSRNPAPTGWGLWAHVARVRLESEVLEAASLEFHEHHVARGGVNFFTLWQLLLRAWAKEDFNGQFGDDQALRNVVDALHQRLRALGLDWLDDQVTAAYGVLLGEDPPGVFFARCSADSWRHVLTSLTALGDESAPGKGAQDADSQLLWCLYLSPAGMVEGIQPMERKRGSRGWNKPKPVPLTRLVGNQKLGPLDLKVVECIRAYRMYQKQFYLDRASAIMALIGHPAVVLDESASTMVDVIAGTPQLEVVRQGEQFVMQVMPPVHPVSPVPLGTMMYGMDETQRKEVDSLRYICVVQDSPQRVRVVRFSAAQRRAAKLVSGRFAVPASAHDELQTALRALAEHFEVHSDDTVAAREEPAQSALRAELSPVGDGLLLRLVAAPLGPDGPRLMPGQGRERVMAAINGESVGTRRDLALEQEHLDAVLERLPFLAPPHRSDTVCEWSVPDPEQALAMVEALPHLAAVAAVDWPRGKPVTVRTIDLTHLKLRVKTEHDWFGVSGGVEFDEGRVFDLQELLAAAAGKSRFRALGEGAYLALSAALRERLVALAAVLEIDKKGVRAPQIASAWLDDALDGMTVDFDRAFRQRIDRLRAAQEYSPALPAGLQAELRPYQEDGYVWAARLADAGLGACLADDMGLGKTLQALAILVARGPGGPALVVAPTSVCGNWLAESLRFAPGLAVRLYGDGERDGVIESLGAGDVLIVSYTHMLLAAEAFASRTWHTLVADEAQAIKNAAAKRSQALFDVPADFRLALSGTPVENRLTELWSIMRFCNPGLLGSLPRFNARFSTPIERDRDREAQRLLRRLIAPFVLRRTKAQVLQDLPPRTELVLTIVPEADEAAHYEALRRTAQAAAANGEGSLLHLLAQITRLRRAACDPRLTHPDIRFVGAKVRAFAELATELVANGHKALVFSQFVDFLTLLRQPLDAAGIRYQYLDGSTAPAERTRRVAAFQAGEGDLFLISLKAGGFGLNLTAADYVVITDPWWNPAAEDQAMGRAHRMGQLRPVTVYRLVSKGTLEERIVELHHDKRALTEGVLAADENNMTLPSTNDLLALMRELT